MPRDLAVEINDSSEPDLTRKVRQYLSFGVRAVGVVAPQVPLAHAPRARRGAPDLDRPRRRR